MSEYCCAFCGLNHGPDPRSNHAPCPRVRALKFDSDGTVLAFKLRGTKGWCHKSMMHRQTFNNLNLIGMTHANTAVIVEVGK